MVRVTKEHDRRRNQFIETSKKLFSRNGFEHTTVDDIVGAMGVAKGLFYYYFESKETLLDEITDVFVEEIREAIAEVISRRDLTAIAKMELLLEVTAGVKVRSRSLVEYFHEPRNRHLHLAVEVQVMEFLVPAIESLIGQGVKEGVFDVENTHYAALAYLGAGRTIGHENTDGLSSKEVMEMVIAFQTLTEKMLGARPGTLDMYQRLTKKNLAKFTSKGHRGPGRVRK